MIFIFTVWQNEFEMAEQDPEVKMIRLATIDKMDTVAVIGALPATIPAAEFAIRKKESVNLQKRLRSASVRT